MNSWNRVVAWSWLAVAFAGTGAELSGAAVIPYQIPGLWQTNGVVFHEGRQYRGVGANYYDLFLRVLHDPTNRTSIEGLGQLGRAGIPFVRFALAYDDADWKLFFDNQE